MEPRFCTLSKFLIPKITDCKNSILKPAIKNHRIITQEHNEIFQCKNELYGILNNCKDFNNIEIHDKTKIVNLTRDTCIPKIIKGEKALCDFSRPRHRSGKNRRGTNPAKRLQKNHRKPERSEIFMRDVLVKFLERNLSYQWENFQ